MCVYVHLYVCVCVTREERRVRKALAKKETFIYRDLILFKISYVNESPQTRVNTYTNDERLYVEATPNLVLCWDLKYCVGVMQTSFPRHAISLLRGEWLLQKISPWSL